MHLTMSRTPLLLATASLALVPVLAQAGAPWQYQDRYAFPVGEASAYYDVELQYGTDSNTRRLDQNDPCCNVTESGYFSIRPHADLIATKGASYVSLEYLGDYRFYGDDEDINYNDHEIRLSGELRQSARNRLKAEFFVLNNHQEVGTGLSTGNTENITAVDTITQTGVDVNYRLGSYASKGMATLRARLVAADYESDDRPSQAAVNDRQTNLWQAGFSYRLTPKIRPLARFDVTTTSYDQIRSSTNAAPDKTETRVGLGVIMRLSPNTDSSIVVGALNSEHDSQAYSDSDYDGTFWDARVTWDVTERSRVFFRGGLRGGDSQGDGSVSSDENFVRVNWRHAWTPLVSSVAEYDTYTREFPTAANDYTIDRIRVGADFSVRRFLNVGVRVARHERTGDNPYERDELALSLSFKP